MSPMAEKMSVCPCAEAAAGAATRAASDNQRRGGLQGPAARDELWFKRMVPRKDAREAPGGVAGFESLEWGFGFYCSARKGRSSIDASQDSSSRQALGARQGFASGTWFRNQCAAGVGGRLVGLGLRFSPPEEGAGPSVAGDAFGADYDAGGGRG